jgi:hypothetical protein
MFKQNFPRKHAELSLTPDLEDDFVHQDEFVNLVRDQAGDTRVVFSLDNEPGLWSNTHPEVHPERVEYDALEERSINHALAIRETWPEAEIAGLVAWG